MRKKGDFLSKFCISAQKCPFWQFAGPIKMQKGKYQKSKNQKVSKYPKEHSYPFLDQSNHFPETSSKFRVKSGYA